MRWQWRSAFRTRALPPPAGPQWCCRWPPPKRWPRPAPAPAAPGAARSTDNPWWCAAARSPSAAVPDPARSGRSPLGHRLPGYAHPVRQLLLGKALCLAQLLNALPQLLVQTHTVPLLFVLLDFSIPDQAVACPPSAATISSTGCCVLSTAPFRAQKSGGSGRPAAFFAFLQDAAAGQCQQHRQQAEVQRAEHRQIPPGVGAGGLGIDLQADQAGNGGAKAAQIHAHQKPRAVLGKAGQQHRRRHIADDLAGRRAHQHLPALHHAGQKILQRRNPGQIAREHEEAHKGDQQSEVRPQHQLSVEHRQRHDHRRQQRGPGQQMEHRGQTHAEQHAAQNQLGTLAGCHGAFLILSRQGDPPGRGEQAQHHQHHKACQRGRHGESEEFARGKAVTAVQIQILGVAHRGEHAAQIGRHRLQTHHPGQQPALPAGGQHQHREGHEGDEGHIVGDQHGGEEAEHHQHKAQPLAAAAALDQRRRHSPEGPGLLHAGHHRHQAVKQSQHPAVHIAKIFLIRQNYQAEASASTAEMASTGSPFSHCIAFFTGPAPPFSAPGRPRPRPCPAG